MSSGSPSLHDQMSIIILKRCPIFRTFIHKIISHCWREWNFPSCWKHAFTILINKKVSKMKRLNFCPKKLQPVFAKIYSSFIWNRICNFLLENQFIESNMQKGFWRAISGTIEHTELLTHIIKHAKNKQRQITITLLYLKNGSEKVDHKLLLKVLDYHHIPDEIKTINNWLLQKLQHYYRYCLSPLLFNMVINILIKTIDEEKILCMGFLQLVRTLKLGPLYVQFGPCYVNRTRQPTTDSSSR